MRKNSVKNSRINGEVQKIIAEIIRGEIKDPRIPQFTSVVSVEVAPDLKNCKVFMSVLGDEVDEENALRGLNSAAGFIRNRLAKELNLRNTPDIHFFMDHSIAYGVDMSKKIDDVIKQDKANHVDTDEEPSEF